MSRDEANVPALAKLSRPALTRVYARERLFALLDQARKSPIVWISAPPGAGKTTLVASYLNARQLPAVWYSLDATDIDVGAFFYYMGLAFKGAVKPSSAPLPILAPEYQAGLPAFTANFFRELFGQLEPRSIVVLDNFQNANDRVIQEVLHQGFDQIPDGVTVVAISREDMPGVFARSRAGGRIAMLGWEDIRLTAEESAGVTKLRRGTAYLESQADALYRRTHGWVAGVVLLTEQANIGHQDSQPDRVVDQSIFDYFANEIFLQLDADAQTLLLKTTFLPVVSMTIARKLAGANDLEDTVLETLTRRNLFTVKHGDEAYAYHPLFRDFLSTRARATFAPAEIRALRQQSAELLAESGDVEAAIELLLQAEDWREAARLAVESARKMSRQGRGQTLYKWLATLPSTLVPQDAWVLYWLGNCRLSIAPREARLYFEQALALFEKQDDAAPLYLVWSKILQSFVAETDDIKPLHKWLDYYSLLRADRAPPSTSIENACVFSYISGLLHARCDHEDLVVYADRAERLFRNDPDRSSRIGWVATLISYHLWRGNVAEIDSLLKQIVMQAKGTDPLAQLTLYMYKAMHAAISGAADDSLRAVTDGLALAASSGVNQLVTELVSYGIWGQLCVGNLAPARSLLQRITLSMRVGQIKEAFYSHYTALVALHEGDVVRAVNEGQRATKLAKASGMFIGPVAHQIGLAYAYVQRGDLDAAQSALAEAEPKAVAMGSKFFVSYSAFCAANIHRLRGDQKLALSALDKALSLAQAGGFVTAGYCPRDTAAVLYSLALENGIRPDYVRATITKTQLLPPREFLSEHWPWRLRIYTLGRFLVMKDGEPLALTARQHKKPLALLRALVSYGGRFVSMTKLANNLWPDTEGDLAMHSLETTLYRLRKLVGDQCIATYNGQLTLNPDYCWLDGWAVEQLAESPSTAGQLDAKIGRIVALYRGVFLDGDESPWVLVERERLRSKLLLAITQLGQANEAQGNYESAVACYQKGVEVDPLAEDLYRYLMACYRQLDQSAKALSVYLRCRDALMSMLRIEPSAKTKALYAEIKGSVG